MAVTDLQEWDGDEGPSEFAPKMEQWRSLLQAHLDDSTSPHGSFLTQNFLDVLYELTGVDLFHQYYDSATLANAENDGVVYVNCGFQPSACIVAMTRAYPAGQTIYGYDYDYGVSDPKIYIDTSDASYRDGGGFYVTYRNVPTNSLEFMVFAIGGVI